MSWTIFIDRIMRTTDQDGFIQYTDKGNKMYQLIIYELALENELF